MNIKCVLLSILLLTGMKCAIAAPVNAVNLTTFTGIEPHMQFKGNDTCLYTANVEVNSKELTVLGVAQPIKQWRFIVPQRQCGGLIEKVSLIAILDHRVKTMPIEAGTAFIIQEPL